MPKRDSYFDVFVPQLGKYKTMAVQALAKHLNKDMTTTWTLRIAFFDINGQNINATVNVCPHQQNLKWPKAFFRFRKLRRIHEMWFYEVTDGRLYWLEEPPCVFYGDPAAHPPRKKARGGP